jgi:hypothetical protein
MTLGCMKGLSPELTHCTQLNSSFMRDRLAMRNVMQNVFSEITVRTADQRCDMGWIKDDFSGPELVGGTPFWKARLTFMATGVMACGRPL